MIQYKSHSLCICAFPLYIILFGIQLRKSNIIYHYIILFYLAITNNMHIFSIKANYCIRHRILSMNNNLLCTDNIPF